MQRNEKLIQQLAKEGLLISFPEKKKVVIEGRLGDVERFVSLAKSGDLELKKSYNKDCVATHVLGKRSHEFSDTDDFHGGNAKELQKALNGEVDMTLFEETRRKFAESELGARLQAKLALMGKKRRRMTSEHDGEWDMSRKWEIRPFHKAYAEPVQVKVLDMYCDFTVSGMATARDITRYGATVWAISDLVEKYGIQTRIVWTIGTSEMLASESGYSVCIDVELKKPGEYLGPTILAGAMTAVFYRRAGFGLIGLGADALGGDVSGSLGRCRTFPKPIEFTKGRLHISPSVASGYDEQIEAQLFEALGISKSVKAA